MHFFVAASLFSALLSVAPGVAASSPAEQYGAASNRVRSHGAIRERAAAISALEKRSSQLNRRCKPKTSTTAHLSTTVSTHKVTSTTSKASVPTNKGSSTSSEPQLNGNSKKALAWSLGGNDGLSNFVNDHTYIIYNWGASAPSKADSLGLSFAPMLWSTKNLDAFRTARGGSNVKYLMGMNEVNLGAQADLSVSEGIALWNAEVRPSGLNGKYLVSPSVTSAKSGLDWMKQFFKDCGNKDGQKNCGVHAVSLHFYGIEAQDLIDYVTNFRSELGNNLPVWLSEFGCQDFTGKPNPTSDQVWAFMEGVVAWAEKTDWVVMYAPFGLSTDTGNVDQKNALMTSALKPTDLGNLFLTKV